jgi:general secretion pathway protein L
MIYEQYLAIDYGTSYIKGVLYKEILGSVTILRSESLKLVRFESDEGDEYEYNIVRFIQSFFPEESTFIINIPLDKIFIRDIVVPLGNEKAVREVIPFEVENVVPFPIEDMVVQGTISRIEAEATRVITFSSHNIDVEKSAVPFSRSDITLKCMSTDPITLSASGKYFYTKTIHDTHYGQLDIGGKVSIFNILERGRLIHSRFFAGGGDFITDKIRKLLRMSTEEAEDFKHSINFSIYEPSLDEIENLRKRFIISEENIKEIFNVIKDSIKEIANEVLKSIHTIRSSERPLTIYLSGGGSLFKDTEKILFDLTGFVHKRYDFLDINDELYNNCVSMSYHYRLRKIEQVNFLTDEFSKRLNKNNFKFSDFKTHIILLGLSLGILSSVFLLSILNDKKKIQSQEEVLRERFKQGFGRELTEEDDVMAEALSEVKKEQKKSEIVRLFLGKESILDLIFEITNLFPPKDELNFILEQFTYDGNEIHIYGKVDEFSDLGTLQNALERSKLFKNIDVQNKRLIQGVTKLRVSFKIKLEIASASEKSPKESKGDSNAE